MTYCIKTCSPRWLDNRIEPELYRDVFPYTHVSRIEFDDTFSSRPADPCSSP